MTVISVLLVALSTILALPVAVFVLEILAAITLSQRDYLMSPGRDTSHNIAVVVPAHNESINLLPTLADIKAQIREGDHLLVVADNCEDDTADVAAAAGADVVVRNDPLRRGKGYALDFGVRHLSRDPPDIVIVVDADCRVADNAIDRLAAACAMTHRPIQALDLMIAPSQSPINFKVAEFAWRVKNWIRPLGLTALGLPCQLMGTGMAFRWEAIRSADLATKHIMEDFKLGVDLASAGNPPVFFPFPAVTSEFPLTFQGAETQRQRWEQGHIIAIATIVPRLIFSAVARVDLNLLALAFDATVPPLSLLVMLLMVASVICGLGTLFGISPAAISINLVNLAALSGGVFVAWLKYGRDILQPGSILLIFKYVLGKIPLYFKILLRDFNLEWIRTDRGKGPH
jgi:cellulose synthase/poly-beta-1,6-N-acetylglucosamine synthase-like glycosyltransferase